MDVGKTNSDSKRSVWIAGASQGIGKDLASWLPTQGYSVTGFARAYGHDLSEADALAKSLGRSGPPWAFVHCIGDFIETGLLETSAEEWEQLVASNLTTFLNSCRVLLPAMAELGRGRIITFGAAGLSLGLAKTRAPAYFAVKAALLSTVKSLAIEWAHKGITINMLSPGLIHHEKSHGASQARLVSRVPAGRLGSPEDLRGSVELLLGDGSAYLTGQEFSIDGGFSLH